MLLDWLTSGGILPFNPAASVRGPKHIIKRGKTPVLTAAEARQLLDSIDTGSLIGLRDRALIDAMVYSFAHATVIGRNGVNFVMEGHSLDRSDHVRSIVPASVHWPFEHAQQPRPEDDAIPTKDSP